MFLTIVIIVVATVAIGSLEIWLLWRLGERDDRRRSRRGDADRTRRGARDRHAARVGQRRRRGVGSGGSRRRYRHEAPADAHRMTPLLVPASRR
jgi:hypothetical protein